MIDRLESLCPVSSLSLWMLPVAGSIPAFAARGRQMDRERPSAVFNLDAIRPSPVESQVVSRPRFAPGLDRLQTGESPRTIVGPTPHQGLGSEASEWTDPVASSLPRPSVGFQPIGQVPSAIKPVVNLRRASLPVLPKVSVPTDRGGRVVGTSGGLVSESATESPHSKFGPGPSPGGGEYDVRIASPGKHGDDGHPSPVDPPDVIQGMAYTVAIDPAEPDSTEVGVEWRLQNETWVYPEVAVKGYGIFTRIDPSMPGGDPDGPYTRFVSQPSSAPNTKVEWQGFEPDDTEYDSSQSEDIDGDGLAETDHFIGTFYWGPEAEGLQTISVSVLWVKYLNNNPTLETINDSDSVTVNVLKPTGTIVELHEGTSGVSESLVGTAQTQYIGDDYRFKGEVLQYPPGTQVNAQFFIDQIQNVGIKWQADAQVPNEGTIGEFTVVQLISTVSTATSENKDSGDQDTFYFRLPKLDANGAQIIAPNGYPMTVPALDTLDTHFPIGAEGATYRQLGQNKAESATAPIGWTLKGYDSPYTGLLNETDAYLPISFDRHDDFTMTLMYTPAATIDGQILGLQAIWVPVAKSVWHWFANANYTAGGNPPWLLGANSGQYVQDTSDPAHTNGNFPPWERNISEASFQVNT